MIRANRNQEKYIQTGLDVGSNKICCAIMEVDPNLDSVKLLGLGASPATGIKKGSITHRDQLIDEMDLALQEAQTMADVNVQKLALGISGDHIRGINTQGAIAIGSTDGSNVPVQHEITDADVHRVLELAKAISLPVDRDILHVLPQEYVIDTMDSIKDPVGLTGRRLEARVHLITVATTAATNLVSCAEELGVTVDGIVYQGLASSIAALVKDEKNLGVVCVDIGSTTTDIVVYHEGGIRHTATLGIGAGSITNDIAVMLQVGIEDAEKIKKTYGSAKASMSSPALDFELPTQNGQIKRKVSEHELSRYVEARMVEILQLIMREVSRADVKEKLTYGMVLTGGGSELKNLVGLAQETINMPVRIGKPNNVSGAVDVASSPIYSSVIGLAQWKNFCEDLSLIQKSGSAITDTMKKLKKIVKEFF
ncbi:MAG: cell division protein FtsA [Candidatus Marinimicrobia bacterium]|nr:cell division protein FtsA [Candidatus Neomarinimicrobiota bacterium]